MIRQHDSIIVQTLGRFLVPVIQIFGLYVLFFGQYGPGGGFVGGVILGMSMKVQNLIMPVLWRGSKSYAQFIAFISYLCYFLSINNKNEAGCLLKGTHARNSALHSIRIKYCPDRCISAPCWRKDANPSTCSHGKSGLRRSTKTHTTPKERKSGRYHRH